MVITVSQIDSWRSLPQETEVIEFKEAKNQYDNTKLCQYCVAIANEGGGHILLGVKNEVPHVVVGTSAFNNLPGIREKLFHELGFRVDVAETNHPDGRVVTFTIPARPRATPLHYQGRYMMRSGEALVSMSPDVLKRICAEDDPPWLDVPSIASVGSGRIMDLLDTESYFRLIEVPLPQAPGDIAKQLLRDNLIVDEGYGAYSIRRMGALLLARNFEDFPELRSKAPRVVRYAGTSKLAPVTYDSTIAKGYAVGFQEIVRTVHGLLPQNEVILDALRTEVKLIPEDVIRELLANALIHQDLEMTGASVVVEVYANRLEINNPGRPIIDVERLIDGYQSRNERLAALMRKMRICEERGRGVDLVVGTAEVLQLPAPDFRVIENRMQVIIFDHKKFEDMDRDDRVRACYQHCALKRVMSESMTNQSLRERFKIPESKSYLVSDVIRATIDAGLIKPEQGTGKSKKLARYVPHWA